MPRAMLPLAVLAVALSAVPAFAQTRADAARQAQLDHLFTALRSAPDEGTAGMIEARIRRLWAEQPSPAAALLMARADRELHGDAEGDAIADYDAVLDLEPDYAEGYTHRAVARAAAGDPRGAIADIEQALAHDKRDFAALEALSRIAEQQGNWQGALDAWKKALEIDPRMPGGAARRDMLRKKVEGEAT
jgi:tetratricopeptide (TPR) repeat protein